MLRSEAKPLNPMLAQASSSTSITPWLRKRIKRIADSNPYLRDELDMLLKRAVDDELMALVRARRIAEIAIYGFCDKNSIKTHDKGNASLNRAIRNLAKTTYATRALVALCDAVRLEGNRCAHCKPGFGKAFKPVRVAPSTLLDTMNRLAEILEVLLLGDDQGYALGLSEPFGSMHRILRSRWAQYLAHKQEGAFPLLEALELLYRSIIRELTPRLLTVLAKYRAQGTLPPRLHSKEKEALRRLRNLSY